MHRYNARALSFHFLNEPVIEINSTEENSFIETTNEAHPRYAYPTLSLSGIKPGIRLFRPILLFSSQREIEKLKFCHFKIGTIFSNS